MDDKLVVHSGMIQAPLRKGFKQVHRLVVLPDYQGIGIGTKFITFIANYLSKQSLTVKLITTTPAIRFALDKSDDWILNRSGKVKPNGNKTYLSHFSKSESSNRITYTYIYTNGTNCCKCSRITNDGLFINNKYYCSDECLHKDYSEEQCEELNNNNLIQTVENGIIIENNKRGI